MGESIPIEECSLEQLVEIIGPEVVRDVGPRGENLSKVLGTMAALAEIEERGKQKEAAQLAVEKFDIDVDELDDEIAEDFDLEEGG